LREVGYTGNKSIFPVLGVFSHNFLIDRNVYNVQSANLIGQDMRPRAPRARPNGSIRTRSTQTLRRSSARGWKSLLNLGVREQPAAHPVRARSRRGRVRARVGAQRRRLVPLAVYTATPTRETLNVRHSHTRAHRRPRVEGL